MTSTQQNSELLPPGRVVRVRTGIAVEFVPARGALVQGAVRHGFEGYLLHWRSDRCRVRGEILVYMSLDMNRATAQREQRRGRLQDPGGRQDCAARTCVQTPCSPLKRRRCCGYPAEERTDLEAADDKTSLLAQHECHWER